MKSMDMTVVFACNDKYVMPLCVAITSMKMTKREQSRYSITILYSELSEYSKRKMMELDCEDCTIDLLNVNRVICDRKDISHDYITKETYFRFYITDLFQNERKILYLDCDVIVRSDLYELYRTDIEGKYAAVVSDIDVEERLRDIGHRNQKYFNAGVMLLNLDLLRKDDIKNKLLRITDEYPHMDQDILNIAIGSNVEYLSEKFNFQIAALLYPSVEICREYYFHECCDTFDEYVSQTVILHMAGPYKPWIFDYPYVSSLFQTYFQASNFSNYKLHLFPFEKNWKELREYFILKYLIPYFEIPSDSRIVLYGADVEGKIYLQQILAKNSWNVMHWIDKDAGDYRLVGLPVEDMDILREKDFDYIILAVEDAKSAEIIKRAMERQYGIASNMILWKRMEYHSVPTIRDVVKIYIHRKERSRQQL